MKRGEEKRREERRREEKRREEKRREEKRREEKRGEERRREEKRGEERRREEKRGEERRREEKRGEERRREEERGEVWKGSLLTTLTGCGRRHARRNAGVGGIRRVAVLALRLRGKAIDGSNALAHAARLAHCHASALSTRKAAVEVVFPRKPDNAHPAQTLDSHPLPHLPFILFYFILFSVV